jgi:hypothetical protein
VKDSKYHFKGEKIMERFGLKISEAGIWFKILFWGSVICTPLTVSMYALFMIEGIWPVSMGMWFTVCALSGFWCIWLLAQQKKLGWTLLIFITVFSAIINTIIDPSQWWVFLSSGVCVYLYYLSLRHKGFWYKLC